MIVETKIGRIGLTEENAHLTSLFFCNTTKNADKINAAAEPPTSLLRSVAAQLNEYLNEKRQTFDVPIRLIGTEFQVSVWRALQTIPYGETLTYRQIAEQIGNPKACRAVGMANHWNPIAILVPCHRVIGADGSLTGYAGGLPLKQRLLDIEQRNKKLIAT